MESIIKDTIISCSGKKYNGEKAIISLTSWKARINTVSKTIYSLLTICPNFHIVLVLSKDEFPFKEKELPENLMVFVNANLVEILWIDKNYKSYKKWIFTSKKYSTLPIISADDDCIYLFNYANELYLEWLKTPTFVIRYPGPLNTPWNHSVSGPCTIYPQYDFFGKFVFDEIKNLSISEIEKSLDDDFYCAVIKKYNIPHRGLKYISTYNGLIHFFNQETGLHSKK